MGLLRSLAKKVLGRQESGPAPLATPQTPSPQRAADHAKNEGQPHHPPEGAEAASTTGGTEKPWYLDGTNDGWDETDVKKDPSGTE